MGVCLHLQVLDATGMGGNDDRELAVGRIQISTCCVQGDLCALGGFNGELVVKNLGCNGPGAVQR